LRPGNREHNLWRVTRKFPRMGAILSVRFCSYSLVSKAQNSSVPAIKRSRDFTYYFDSLFGIYNQK
jgi:hypothetical protein